LIGRQLSLVAQIIIPMRFVATDVFDYYRPSKCGLRVYLRAHGIEEAPTSPFEETLRKLGRAHEARHLATLAASGDVADVSRIDDRDERERETLRLLSEGAPVIYQGRLRVDLHLEGEEYEIVGEPDYLIRSGAGHVIRDSKLARKIDGRAHPEIALQLQLYGLLYERLTGRAPAALEVHAGSDEIVPVPYDGGGAALGYLRFLRSLRSAASEPYEPVGWTKCGGCGYQERCWSRAEELRDVALLPAVSQSLARALAARGIRSFQDLLSGFDQASLAAMIYRDATGQHSIGASSESILRSARVMSTGHEELLGSPDLPGTEDCVLLDLEGLPAYLDELEKIYLWGLKTMTPGLPRYVPALAGFAPDGDRHAWEEFLRTGTNLLEERPTRRFVHWGGYEKSKIALYMERYGDPDGVAARLRERLFDLLPTVRKSVVLPLPSSSLKVVERHVGFQRRLPEARGQWAMARYIEATETSDRAARDRILNEILTYNEEDLDATWAVLSWLRELRGQ